MDTATPEALCMFPTYKYFAATLRPSCDTACFLCFSRVMPFFWPSVDRVSLALFANDLFVHVCVSSPPSHVTTIPAWPSAQVHMEFPRTLPSSTFLFHSGFTSSLGLYLGAHAIIETHPAHLFIESHASSRHLSELSHLLRSWSCIDVVPHICPTPSVCLLFLSPIPHPSLRFQHILHILLHVSATIVIPSLIPPNLQCLFMPHMDEGGRVIGMGREINFSMGLGWPRTRGRCIRDWGWGECFVLGGVLLSWTWGSAVWILYCSSVLTIFSLLARTLPLHASLDKLFPSCQFHSSCDDTSSFLSMQCGCPSLLLLLLLHHSHIKILDPPLSAVTYRSAYHLSFKVWSLPTFSKCWSEMMRTPLSLTCSDPYNWSGFFILFSRRYLLDLTLHLLISIASCPLFVSTPAACKFPLSCPFFPLPCCQSIFQVLIRC